MTGLPSLSSLRDRRTRARIYAAFAIVLVAVLAFQAVTASPVNTGATSEEGRWTVSTTEEAEDTGTATSGTDTGTGTEAASTTEDDGVQTRDRRGVLIGVQSYGGFGSNNGRAILVQDGEVVWSFAPEDSRVFDTEMLDNGNVLVSYGTELPAEECPERTLEHAPDECVRNNVVELDYDTKDVVWEYRWYDAFIEYHEVHDADRLESGETAIIDMGNDRSFVVDEDEDIVWEWSAREHMGPGSEFWETYGGPSEPEPESDWTHMNDIDRLDNGHFLMSIRNFDVLVEVNRSTKEIEQVVGEPRGTDEDVEGREPILDDQHNPMMVDDGHVVVADSETDRIAEIDTARNEVVWTYGAGLTWPRDADRLPNGNTLVTNSLGYEVREVTPEGDVVWSYEIVRDGKRGIPYEADRVMLPEEPSEMPSIAQALPYEEGTTVPDDAGTGTATAESTATDPAGSSAESGGSGGSVDESSGSVVDRYQGYVLLYLPTWMGPLEVALILLLVVVAGLDGLAFAANKARRAAGY